MAELERLVATHEGRHGQECLWSDVDADVRGVVLRAVNLDEPVELSPHCRSGKSYLRSAEERWHTGLRRVA